MKNKYCSITPIEEMKALNTYIFFKNIGFVFIEYEFDMDIKIKLEKNILKLLPARDIKNVNNNNDIYIIVSVFFILKIVFLIAGIIEMMPVNAMNLNPKNE